MVKEKALGFNSPGALTFGVMNMKKDISNQQFGRLTAKEIIGKDKKEYLWRCECECGGEKEVPAAYLRNGHTRSCGCLNKQTRSDTVKYRKDLVAGTSISNIVVSKRLRSNNTSGHTGVWHDKKHDRWHAFINFQGKHYNLGTHPTFQSAVKARRAAEERLHDPAIIAHIETLTEERRKEFAMYLRNNGGTI